jgi:hypothetical protein
MPKGANDLDSAAQRPPTLSRSLSSTNPLAVAMRPCLGCFKRFIPSEGYMYSRDHYMLGGRLGRGANKRVWDSDEALAKVAQCIHRLLTFMKPVAGPE